MVGVEPEVPRVTVSVPETPAARLPKVHVTVPADPDAGAVQDAVEEMDWKVVFAGVTKLTTTLVS